MSAWHMKAASRSSLPALGTGTPRVLILYGRSRGLWLSLAGVIGVCMVFRWMEAWGERGDVRQALLLQAIPVLLASVIGLSVWSPFGEPERTSARSLPRIRAVHLATLFLPAIVIAALLVSAWTPLVAGVDLVYVVVRNIVGLTGVALLCGRVIDARLTWIGPLLWLAFVMIGTMLIPLNGGKGFVLWHAPWWAWTGQSDASGSAWMIALALGVAGAALMCRFGPRDAAAEEQ